MDEQIPAELKGEERWVCWQTETRDGKSTKVPVDPQTGEYASVSTPATWSTISAAWEYCRQSESVDGIGFVFRENGPYAGVDLDDCRDPVTGDVEDWAVDVLRRLDSYTERSPSGTGFHVIVKGAVPNGGNRNGDLEMYDRNRYFTVTGDRVPGAPTTVEHREEALRAVHEEYIADTKSDTTPVPAQDRPNVSIADAELLEKAKNAANGDKFQRLWNGDTSDYPSHSEADQALCMMLAFWTGGDPQRIERLFARSGLVRGKWRERLDYRERTIQTALQHCSDFYEPLE